MTAWAIVGQHPTSGAWWLPSFWLRLRVVEDGWAPQLSTRHKETERDVKRGIGAGLMAAGSDLFGKQGQGDAERSRLPRGALKTFAQTVEEDGTVPSGYQGLILLDVDERDGSVVLIRKMTPGWEGAARAVNLERLMAGSKVKWREEASTEWRGLSG